MPSQVKIAIVGASVLVPVAFTGFAAAAGGPQSSSTLATLDIKQVDAIGLTGFSGKYGTAGTGPAGGRDQSNFPDPQGVTKHVTITGAKNSQTSGITAPVVYDARVDINTLSFVLAGSRTPLIRFATLQNYARCAPPAAALATAYVVDPRFLGRPLTAGKPLRASVNGTEIGLPKVKSGTVTVTMTEIKITNGADSAEARTVFDLTGDLTTTDGHAFRGSLGSLTLGDVRAECVKDTPTPPPTPTPTPTPTTPEPTPTPTPTTPIPTPEPTTPSPSPTGSVVPTPTPSPSADHEPEPARPRDHGELPFTGFPAAMLALGGLLLTALGGAIFSAVRKRRA